MATVWKKVLMEGSAIDINDIVGVTAMEKGQILRGDANGDVENIDVSSGNIIYGGSAADALLCSFGSLADGLGLVAPSLTAEDGSAMTGTVTFSVADAAIGTIKIQDNAVTLDKIADQSHGVMVYHQTGGIPTLLEAGSAGDVLKVSDTGVGFTFGAPEATSLIDISDADTLPDTTERRILFGGTTGDGLESSQTVYGDTEFTYKNQEEITTSAFTDWASSYVNTNIISTANSSGALKTPETAGIVGTLVGTARASMYQHVKTLPSNPVPADDNFYNLSFYKTAGISGTGFSHLAGHEGLSYNPKEKALKVTNLIVDGTQTTINTTNLQVEDKTIRLGIGATETTSVSSGDASGTGIVVNIGRAGFDVGDEDGVAAQNVEADLPRVIWDNGSGTQSSSQSVLGWKAAYKGAGADGALDASTAYGIGVMHVTDQTAASALGANLNDAQLSIGVGAMALVDWDGEPALYIQTAL